MLTAFSLIQAVLLLTVVSAHFASVLDGRTKEAGPGTGDFAAFFTGAALVDQGLGSALYDFSVQRKVQEETLGGELTDWQPYLNPPGLAILLAPSVQLGYERSFLIFSTVLPLFLLAFLGFLISATPSLNSSRLSAFTGVLLIVGFLPVSLTAFGGQNTALSLGLLSGIYAASRRENHVLAGILLGLLTFKPQYALVVGSLFLFRKDWRIVGFGILVAFIHYGAAALYCGFDWPLDFLKAMSEHRPLEMAANAPRHFSIPVVSLHTIPGKMGGLVAVLGSAIVLWFSFTASLKVRLLSPSYPAFFGLVVCAALLVSPHLQYYEVGILALPVLLGVETILESNGIPSLRTRIALSVGYFAYPFWRLGEEIGFQPLFLLLTAVWIWMLRLVLRDPAPFADNQLSPTGLGEPGSVDTHDVWPTGENHAMPRFPRPPAR